MENIHRIAVSIEMSLRDNKFSKSYLSAASSLNSNRSRSPISKLYLNNPLENQLDLRMPQTNKNKQNSGNLLIFVLSGKNAH